MSGSGQLQRAAGWFLLALVVAVMGALAAGAIGGGAAGIGAMVLVGVIFVALLIVGGVVVASDVARRERKVPRPCGRAADLAARGARSPGVAAHPGARQGPCHRSGARAARSRLRGIVQPSAVLDVECWRGRELDGVAQAQLVAANLAGRGDLDPDTVGWCYELLDLADGLSEDGHGDDALFALLARGLGLLVEAPSRELFAALTLRAVQLAGFGPSLDRCGSCGAEGELTRIDPASQQARCDACGGVAIGVPAMRAARLVLEGRTRDGLRAVDAVAARRFEELATRIAEAVLGRRLRGLAHVAPEPRPSRPVAP